MSLGQYVKLNRMQLMSAYVHPFVGAQWLIILDTIIVFTFDIVAFGRPLQINPRLHQFKLDRSEIWQDCSSCKYASTDWRHSFKMAAITKTQMSNTKPSTEVLPSGDCCSWLPSKQFCLHLLIQVLVYNPACCQAETSPLFGQYLNYCFIEMQRTGNNSLKMAASRPCDPTCSKWPLHVYHTNTVLAAAFSFKRPLPVLYHMQHSTTTRICGLPVDR